MNRTRQKTPNASSRSRAWGAARWPCTAADPRSPPPSELELELPPRRSWRPAPPAGPDSRPGRGLAPASPSESDSVFPSDSDSSSSVAKRCGRSCSPAAPAAPASPSEPDASSSETSEKIEVGVAAASAGARAAGLAQMFSVGPGFEWKSLLEA
jgi:hypothetical protein